MWHGIGAKTRGVGVEAKARCSFICSVHGVSGRDRLVWWKLAACLACAQCQQLDAAAVFGYVAGGRELIVWTATRDAGDDTIGR